MKLFLVMRPWQLFALTWGLPILTTPSSFEERTTLLFLIMMTLFAVSTLGWLYALGTEIPKKLPEELRISPASFNAHLRFIAFAFFLIIPVALFWEQINTSQTLRVIVLLPFSYFFVAAHQVFKFISQSLASLELNRVATAKEYAGYMILFWFYPMGIWTIQPRVNKIFAEQKIEA